MLRFSAAPPLMRDAAIDFSLAADARRADKMPMRAPFHADVIVPRLRQRATKITLPMLMLPFSPMPALMLPC